MEADASLAFRDTAPAGQTLRGRLSEGDLRSTPSLVARREKANAETWADDPTDPQFVIRQVMRERPVPRPSRIVFVVDGSQAMRAAWRQIIDALERFQVGTEVALVFVGDTPERPWDGVRGATAENMKELGAWLAARKPTGGRDNLPALCEAWDLAAAQPGGALVWVHGPQPVLVSRIEGLLQRIERDRTPPVLHDLGIGAGPNRVVEQLDTFRGLRPVRMGNDAGAALNHLSAQWTGRAPEWVLERERIPRTDALAEDSKTDRHLARLWGAEEVERLRLAAEQGSLDRAIKLALGLQLVTPVSGAVVLERAEQYKQHGLEQIDPASAPTVPEPGAAALLVAGAGLIFSRRWRRTARGGGAQGSAPAQ
jgi:hypothetical protein